MRLLGAPTLKDVVPEMVDAHNIHSHIVSVPGDTLYDSNCKFPVLISQVWSLIHKHRRCHEACHAEGDPRTQVVVQCNVASVQIWLNTSLYIS